MGAELGRKTLIGFGKESTAGTAVAPSFAVPQQEVGIEDVPEYLNDDSGIGTRFATFFSEIDQERAEGAINTIMYDGAIAHFANAVMGSVSSEAHADASGAHVHTYSVGNTLPTYTIARKDANADVRHANGILNSLELSVEPNSYVMANMNWLAHKGASASNTLAITAQNRFRPRDVTVKLADSVAELSGASALRVESLTLSINNNVITRPQLGSSAPAYYPGEIETSLSMGRLYLDSSIKDLVFGNQPKAIQIAFTRSDIEIGTGTPTNPSVVFTFEPGFFTEWNREGGLSDLKTESMTYTPIYSISASKQFGLVITNTEETV